MKNSLKNNQFGKFNEGIPLAIVMGALIIGIGVYFGLANSNEFSQKIKEPQETTDECLASSEAIVTKVIDGDTVIVEGGYHIRLLGIDTDESGHSCYKSAKKRIEELILNKKVRLERDKTDVDQYGRCLRYIFLDNQNIGLQLVEEGLAIARFYPPDTKYREEITKAEEEAVDNKIGCKWSENSEKSLKTPEETEPNEFQWEKLTTERLGYRVTSSCKAEKWAGEKLIVEGKVADAYHDLKSNTVFLNFGSPYPNSCFTGVIFDSNLHKFTSNPEKYYLNKTVRIMGKVKVYKGQPEIILETPDQIEIGK